MAKTSLDHKMNTLSLALNEREYKLLHTYLAKRTPSTVQKRAFTPREFARACENNDKFSAATTRTALRVFVSVGIGMKGYEALTRFIAQRKGISPPQKKRSFVQSPAFRLALSISSIIYLHRLLYRFFVRLRLRLLAEKAERLRKRYPHLGKALTSRYTPAVGASLAGLALGIYPKDQLRLTLAIYVGAKALEFLHDALDAEGYLKNKPKWLGSWLLFPLAQGQLLHAFVFDRDCFPKDYGDFILKHSPYYIQKRPSTATPSVPWPDTYEIIDALAETARLRWPPYVSPIILPNHRSPLPPTINPVISSITSSAHPLLHSNSLSCAILHPSTPSCLHAFLNHMLTSAPSLLRFFTIVFSALSLLRYKAYLHAPLSTLNSLSKQILKTTFIISSAIGTAWSSICLFQQILPRKLIPQWRFFLGGFLGGCFAYFDRQRARGLAIYAARTSADSFWKVGVKRRWWREVKGGDVIVFAASLGLLGVVMERNKDAVGKSWERLALEIVKGERELGLEEPRTQSPESEREVQPVEEGKERAEATETTPASDSGKSGNGTSEEGDWQKVAGKETR